MRDEIITNKEYNDLGISIENYIEEHLGTNMDGSQLNDILQIVCKVLGMKKE